MSINWASILGGCPGDEQGLSAAWSESTVLCLQMLPGPGNEQTGVCFHLLPSDLEVVHKVVQASFAAYEDTCRALAPCCAQSLVMNQSVLCGRPVKSLKRA